MSYTLRQKKVALIAKAIREISERNMKRKLQDTEPTTTPTTNSTTEEGTKADDPPEAIDPETPISRKTPPLINNPNAGLQIVKFYNFKSDFKDIKFGLYLFFFRMRIARRVHFRLRVNVGGNSRRNRNLEEEQAESVPSTCEIKDLSLVDTIDETGNKIDYDCEATTKDLNASQANITLNTDVPMTLEDKDGKDTTLSFENVNFKGNSSNQASNLQEAEEDTSKDVNLKDVEIVLPDGNEKSFTLKGKVEPANGLKNDDTFDLTVPTSSQKEPATVTCKVKKVIDGEATMECTSDAELNSKMSDFHNVATTVNGNPLNIEVKEGMKNEDPVKTGQYYVPAGNGNTNRYYRNSSSGLSGGAIAGIVIACVVALAAASIAAIMLRKPAPPIDNTTVVGLKTVENI
jgi:hypothetical protein